MSCSCEAVQSEKRGEVVCEDMPTLVPLEDNELVLKAFLEAMGKLDASVVQLQTLRAVVARLPPPNKQAATSASLLAAHLVGAKKNLDKLVQPDASVDPLVLGANPTKAAHYRSLVLELATLNARFPTREFAWDEAAMSDNLHSLMTTLAAVPVPFSLGLSDLRKLVVALEGLLAERPLVNRSLVQAELCFRNLAERTLIAKDVERQFFATREQRVLAALPLLLDAAIPPVSPVWFKATSLRLHQAKLDKLNMENADLEAQIHAFSRPVKPATGYVVPSSGTLLPDQAPEEAETGGQTDAVPQVSKTAELGAKAKLSWKQRICRFFRCF